MFTFMNPVDPSLFPVKITEVNNNIRKKACLRVPISASEWSQRKYLGDHVGFHCLPMLSALRIESASLD